MKILGYITIKNSLLNTFKACEHPEYSKEWGKLDKIVYEAPKEIANEDKYIYMVNTNSHYSTLRKTTDLTSAIKYYSALLAGKGNFMYDEIPSIKIVHEKYLELLKFKKQNPKAIFGKEYFWK